MVVYWLASFLSTLTIRVQIPQASNNLYFAAMKRPNKWKRGPKLGADSFMASQKLFLSNLGRHFLPGISSSINCCVMVRCYMIQNKTILYASNLLLEMTFYDETMTCRGKTHIEGKRPVEDLHDGGRGSPAQVLRLLQVLDASATDGLLATYKMAQVVNLCNSLWRTFAILRSLV